MLYLIMLCIVISLTPKCFKQIFEILKPKPYEKATLPKARGTEKDNKPYYTKNNCFTDWVEPVCLN
jgi:hypothetical protein